MKLDISRILRLAREEKQLSLRSVASAVGVSPSLLSQVETGKAQPSVGTLYALVNHLDLSLDAVLRGNLEPSSTGTPPAPHTVVPNDSSHDAALRGNTVQRSADNPIIEMQNGVTWERLAVGGHTFVDPLLVTYQPGASSGINEKLMRHSGIEFGYILEGELTLRLEFDTFTVREGDSFSFSSERPHLFVNRSDASAKGIWYVVGRLDLAMPSDTAASLDTPGVVEAFRNGTN